MYNLVNRLWSDDAGFVVSSELVLIATVLVIGLLVGMVTIRDQLVQELGDVADAIANVNQSYSFSAVTGHHSSTAGSDLDDQEDDCDQTAPTAGSAPACIGLATNPNGAGEDTN